MNHDLNLSLKDLFTGNERIISIGVGNTRSDWLNLKPNIGEQNRCNEQGFNMVKTCNNGCNGNMQARLGQFMNQEDNCNTIDTFIGVGIKETIDDS